MNVRNLITPAQAETFWAYVERSNSCWNWTASCDSKGYGQYAIGTYKPNSRRNARAHQVSYALTIGEVPENMVIDHLCRNRTCVNPAHMEVVTNKDNILRGVSPSSKHAIKTHCPYGHPYNDSNTRLNAGSRVCRTCHRQREALRKIAQRSRDEPSCCAAVSSTPLTHGLPLFSTPGVDDG
jgi:hypothetical protein